MKLRIAIISCLLVIVCSATVRADDAGVEFFEKKVRPLLVKHCYECHAADAKQVGGNLLLDHREGARKGGDSGAALLPGKPGNSLLVTAIRYEDEGLKMPPKGKLPAEAIADLEAWIKMGAPDPREKPVSAKSSLTWEDSLKSRRDWWSLQPVRKPPIPQARDEGWAVTPIDRFILAGLEAKSLAPAGLADPRTLARRLSLVITGLPPTPEQVEAFVRDCEEADASRIAGGTPQRAFPTEPVERFVDSLLSSPHFGERWARHWLDVVRFTETHGNEWNYEVHHAWRYRDYLIRAFNADVPYDQFVREHVAGDLLPKARWNERERFNESIIGTAFYRFGEVNHDDCISLRQIGYDLADNQLDTLTKAFQATTVACARCHDHKLDAISQHDYHGLLGILRSSRLVSHTLDAPDVNEKTIGRLKQIKADIRGELAAAWRREASEIPKYMLAAQAKQGSLPTAEKLAEGLDPKRLEKWLATLKVEKSPLEDPFEPWRSLAGSTKGDEAKLPAEWSKLVEKYGKEDAARTEFNERSFETFADFRRGGTANWQTSGQGLRDTPRRSGEFAVNSTGETVVAGIFPAGCYTNAISDRLNGALRSPIIPAGKKHLSLQVVGQRSSAVRLVSNNCQLNYKNYKALTKGELEWFTFELPEDVASLRAYAELMTMFDNPKFPDQLSALGGDTGNYKLPWDKAAENPSSFFGITRAVLHDSPEPPKPELNHLWLLLAGDAPTTHAEVAQRCARSIELALQTWAEGKATDEDIRWLDALVRRELIGNGLALTARLESLVKEYRQVASELALPRISPGVADFGPGFEQPVFVRGDCLRPGEPAPRRYLEVLANNRAPLPSTGSGRLELAELLASPGNPLTARVMVNRVWHHVFGSGLVRTVDDFGHLGDLPSHPELLDHLAARFVEDGWSVKRLIRSLVLSRAFQAESKPSAMALEADPENRLLQHYPARRLEAEAIRDSLLAASGRLDGSLFGMSIQPFREKENADRRLFPGPLDGAGRRSIYIKNNLMEAPKFLAAFNIPGGKTAQGRRDVSNTPSQALALLNDPFVWQQAGLWGARLASRGEEPLASRIDAMFTTALGRPARADEQARFAELAARLADLHQVPPAKLLASREVWQDLAHALFNTREFIFIP